VLSEEVSDAQNPISFSVFDPSTGVVLSGFSNILVSPAPAGQAKPKTVIISDDEAVEVVTIAPVVDIKKITEVVASTEIGASTEVKASTEGIASTQEKVQPEAIQNTEPIASTVAPTDAVTE